LLLSLPEGAGRKRRPPDCGPSSTRIRITASLQRLRYCWSRRGGHGPLSPLGSVVPSPLRPPKKLCAQPSLRLTPLLSIFCQAVDALARSGDPEGSSLLDDALKLPHSVFPTGVKRRLLRLHTALSGGVREQGDEDATGPSGRHVDLDVTDVSATGLEGYDAEGDAVMVRRPTAIAMATAGEGDDGDDSAERRDPWAELDARWRAEGAARATVRVDVSPPHLVAVLSDDLV